MTVFKHAIVRAIQVVALTGLVCSVLAGCANYGGNQYQGRQIRSAQTVDHGTIVSVTPVELDKDEPAILGPLGGAIVGGVVGSMFGAGRGRTLAAVGGAAAGGAGGYMAEKAVSKQAGLEIMVRLDSGQELSIVQGAQERFSSGERVRVLRGQDGTARVQR